MNQIPASDKQNIPLRDRIETKIKNWINRTRALNGEPRYVAMGMAVGIFVSATPTIPFQTLIAVALCLIVRGSKAAAAVGVWLSNPLTFPVFYLASYKTGTLLFGISNGHEISGYTTSDMLKLGVDITVAAVAGGIVIGMILGVAAYFMTYKTMAKIRSREKRQKRLIGRRQRSENRGQPSECKDQNTPHRKLRTASERKISPGLISDQNDPACNYTTSISCHTTTRDQRTETRKML